MESIKVVIFDEVENLSKENIEALFVKRNNDVEYRNDFVVSDKLSSQLFSISAFDNSYSPNITFWSDDNIKVGKLSFSNGVLKFEGNAEESAKVFINALGRQLGVPLEFIEKTKAE